jgi:hypothetical protein
MTINTLHPLTNKLYENLKNKFFKLINTHTKIYTTREDLIQEFYLLTNQCIYKFNESYSVGFKTDVFANEEEKEINYEKRLKCYIYQTAKKKINQMIFEIEDVIAKKNHKFNIIEIEDDYVIPIMEEFGDIELLKQVLEQFKNKVNTKTYQWFEMYFSLDNLGGKYYEFNPMSLEQIGLTAGCSKQNVSLIMLKSINTFRRMYKKADISIKC